MVIYADKTEHKECRTAHKHERELHSGIILVARAPDTDEKVHGYQRNLIEHEHREKVHRYEESVHTCRKEYKPKEELLGLRYLPRREAAGHHYDAGEDEHGYGNTVDTYGKMYVKRRKPFPGAQIEHWGIVACGTQS